MIARRLSRSTGFIYGKITRLPDDISVKDLSAIALAMGCDLEIKVTPREKNS